MSRRAFRKDNSRELKTIVRNRDAQLSALLAKRNKPYLMSDAAAYNGPLSDISVFEAKLDAHLKHEVLYRLSCLTPSIEHWTPTLVKEIPDEEVLRYRELYLSMLTMLAVNVANVRSPTDVRKMVCSYLKPAIAATLEEAEHALFQRAKLLEEDAPMSGALSLDLFKTNYSSMKKSRKRSLSAKPNQGTTLAYSTDYAAPSGAKCKARLTTIRDFLSSNPKLDDYVVRPSLASANFGFVVKSAKSTYSLNANGFQVTGYFESTYVLPTHLIRQVAGHAHLSITDAEDIASHLADSIRVWLDSSQKALSQYLENTYSALEDAIQDNQDWDTDAIRLACNVKLERLVAGWGPDIFKSSPETQLVSGVIREYKEQLALREAKAITQLHDYPAFFPAARAMNRRFVFLSGPTNSGKSWLGYEELAKAKSGLYLAPLRLLALEGQEQLTKRGVVCSLQTGEEQDWIPGARHLSATVEMANFNQVVDVALIDEIQLLASVDRGWAWTAACIGAPAKTIYVAGSPDALPFLERVVALTGDTLEVQTFERLAPLGMTPGPVRLTDVQKGDAVIAFSRRDVLSLRDELQQLGYNVACIYGALGAEVRRAEAARFKDGSAEILVSTDAIGLGLNLDIQRVVFSSITKYDGTETRPLRDTELRQIAGRAGRYGIHAKGEVAGTTAEDQRFIAGALSRPLTPEADTRLWVAPPWYAVARVSELTGLTKLGPILRFIRKNQLASGEHLRDVEESDNIQVADLLDTTKLPLSVRFAYLGAPLELRQDQAVLTFKTWTRLHGQGAQVPAPFYDEVGQVVSAAELQRLENDAKILTTYLWLSLRWPDVYYEEDVARWSLQQVNEGIAQCLRTTKATKQRKAPNPKAGKTSNSSLQKR